MLDTLKHTDFEPHVNSVFHLRILPDTSLQLMLTQVRLMNPIVAPATGAGRSRAFSLLFRGPRDPVLPQSMYTFEHETIGVIESLFIVPIGRDDQGTSYEAIFN